MLYPNFKELIEYESSAALVGYHIKNKKFSALSGGYTSFFKGQGIEFDELREYNINDDVKNIDWRVSAKLGTPFIKTYREEKQRNVVICVDKNNYMNFGTRNTFKNIVAARLASIIGFAANKNNDKVGFYIFGNLKDRFEYYKPVSSKSSIFKGLKSLCNTIDNNQFYSVDGAIYNLKRLNAKPNIVIIISDFRGVNETFEKNLYMLSKTSEIFLINIIDDGDFNIPDIGKIVLKEGKKRYLLNTSFREGVKNYRRNFERRLSRFKKMQKKARAKSVTINTKQDPVKHLIKAFKQNI